MTMEGVTTTASPNPDKTTKPRQLHEKWIQTLQDHTITIYTDGSKLANGAVGCGWVIYYSGDQQLHRFMEGQCHLSNRAEVFDAKLHAIHEAVFTPLTTTLPSSTVFICIDNQASIDTLQFNRSNHEYSRRVLEIIRKLQLLGWHITTMWCPSHCGIRGNERANTLAKLAASSTIPCQFAVTTKTWLLTQTWSEFLARWKNELPLANPSFKFPSHLCGVDWADTRAIWRVFYNQSPTDPPLNITVEPYACGLDLNSSLHLLQDCPLMATQRAILLHSTIGDIQTPGFLTRPQNTQPLRQFLRKTILGHSSHLNFDSNHDLPETIDPTDTTSPELDFSAFEP